MKGEAMLHKPEIGDEVSVVMEVVEIIQKKINGEVTPHYRVRAVSDELNRPVVCEHDILVNLTKQVADEAKENE